MIWYLVLIMVNSYNINAGKAMVVIPTPYYTEGQCQAAGDQFVIKSRGNTYHCTQASEAGYSRFQRQAQRPEE